MDRSISSGNDLAGFGPDSIQDPIQFILRDHDRQLEVCSDLEQLVSASETEPIVEWAVPLLKFLTRDLPLHVSDEERGLFPMIHSRQPPEGDLGAILDQLIMEHEMDMGLADLVTEGLQAIIDGGTPDHPIRFQMTVRAFCEMQRRHLIWENRIVLPLAETLLTDEDKQELAHQMVARRGGS